MPLNKSKYLPCLLSLFLVGAVYFIFGFYYEGNDDSMFVHALRGTFFETPVTDFFVYHKLTAWWYAWLYSNMNYIPWYVLSMYLLLTISLGIYFMVIWRWLERHTDLSLPAKLFIIVIFFSLSFVTSLIFLNFTRVALLLGSACIFMLSELIYYPYGKRLALGIAACLGLFTIAILTRLQAGILCIMLLAPFMLLLHGSRWPSLKRLGLLFLPLIALVVLHKVSDVLKKDHGTAYYREVTPYLTNILDAGFSYLPVNATPADSMRLQAVKNWSLGDRETVNQEFLSQVTGNKTFDLSKLNTSKYTFIISNLYKDIDRGQSYFILILAAIFLALVFSNKDRLAKRNMLLKWLAFNITFFVVVFSITVFIKMPARVLHPLCTIYSMFSILLILIAFRDGERKIRKAAGILFSAAGATLLLIICAVKLREVKGRADNRQDMVQTYEAAVSEINSSFRGKYIVYHLEQMSHVLAYQDVFATESFNPQNDYLIYDGWGCLLEPYPKYLSSICGSEKFDALFDFILAHKDKFVFVSDDERNALVSSYLDIVYGKKILFVEINAGKSKLPGKVFQVYQLQ